VNACSLRLEMLCCARPRCPEAMDRPFHSGGKGSRLEPRENALDGYEVLLADGCPGELRDILRSLGNITARQLDINSLGRGAILDLRRTTLVLLPAYDSDGCPIDAVAAAIRSRSPHISVFVCASTLRDVQGRLPSLAWSGVDQVFVLATRTDRSTAAASIRRRLLAPPPAQALRAVVKATQESQGRTLAMWLLRNGCFPLGVKDVRTMFGKDLKTLKKSLATFDTIGVLLRLGIVLHAQELPRVGVVRAHTIAAHLGLSGCDSLRRKVHLVQTHTFHGVLHDIVHRQIL
jgi:hypothetical protein